MKAKATEKKLGRGRAKHTNPNIRAVIASVRKTYWRFVPKSSIQRLKSGFRDQGKTSKLVQKVTSSLPTPRSVNISTETIERAT